MPIPPWLPLFSFATSAVLIIFARGRNDLIWAAGFIAIGVADWIYVYSLP